MEAINAFATEQGIPPSALVGGTVLIAGAIGLFLVTSSGSSSAPAPPKLSVEKTAAAAEKQAAKKARKKAKKQADAKAAAQAETVAATTAAAATTPAPEQAPKKSNAEKKAAKKARQAAAKAVEEAAAAEAAAAEAAAAKRAEEAAAEALLHAEANKIASAFEEVASKKKKRNKKKKNQKATEEQKVAPGKEVEKKEVKKVAKKQKEKEVEEEEKVDPDAGWTMVDTYKTNKPRKPKAAAPIEDAGGTVIELGSAKSAVIGKGGATIKSITEESGAKIDIPKSGLPGSNACTITGTAQQIAKATKRIQEIVARSGQGPDRDGGASSGGPPAHTDSIIVGKSIGAVIGKGGATIKRITEASGANVNIPRDNNDAGTVNISGTVEAVAKAKMMIKELLKPAGDSIAMKVGGDKVKIVIGRAGSNIKKIQAESGAHIDIQKEGNAEGVIKISGSKEQIAKAKAMISEALKPVVAEATETVELGSRGAGIVIGKGGSTVRALQEQTGANIEIDSRDRAKPTCTISGSTEAVQKAKAAVTKLLEDNKLEEASVNIGAYSSFIIGRGGGTIKRVKEESGAVSLNVSRDGDPDNRTCTVMGTPAAVAAATAALEKLLEAAKTSNQGSGGPLPEGHEKCVVELPEVQGLVGVIIGKGGANVKALQEESGAKVNIERGSGKVEISGSAEAVAAAKESLEAIIARQQERMAGVEVAAGETPTANGHANGDAAKDGADWDTVDEGEGW